MNTLEHPASTKRFGRALSAFVVISTVAACSGNTAHAAGPAGEVLDRSAAESIVRSYDERNNDVNAKRSLTGLDDLEAVPLLTSSKAWMTITTTLDQSTPPIIDNPATFYISAAGNGPGFFLCVSQRTRGGTPNTNLTYTVFARNATVPDWRAVYSITPQSQAPHSFEPSDPTGAHAAAQSVTANDVDSVIYHHYTENAVPDDGLVSSPALDDQLTAGFSLARDALKKRGVRLERKLVSTSPEQYSVPVAGGGYLLFSSSVVSDELVAEKGASYEFRGGSNEAALAGKPKGLSAQRFEVSRLQMFLVFLPDPTTTRGMAVEGYSEVPISVKY